MATMPDDLTTAPAFPPSLTPCQRPVTRHNRPARDGCIVGYAPARTIWSPKTYCRNCTKRCANTRPGHHSIPAATEYDPLFSCCQDGYPRTEYRCGEDGWQLTDRLRNAQ